MRHAVLGGVGALLGATLARAGCNVVLLMREESLARYNGGSILFAAARHGLDAPTTQALVDDPRRRTYSGIDRLIRRAAS